MSDNLTKCHNDQGWSNELNRWEKREQKGKKGENEDEKET